MKLNFFLSAIIILSSCSSYGSKPVNDSLLIGTWKGTSICQIKPSACNDEIAVYHILKGEKKNVFHMIMNKMVNGKEEDMGEHDYTFNEAGNSLFCHDDKYDLDWNFTVKGNTMEGTLKRGNILYRIIKLTKEK